jgi:hypothetical protein
LWKKLDLEAGQYSSSSEKSDPQEKKEGLRTPRGKSEVALASFVAGIPLPLLFF